MQSKWGKNMYFFFFIKMLEFPIVIMLVRESEFNETK